MITITRSALVALLARVTPVLQGKSSIPVLAGARFTVSEGRLHAEATNLDQWIATSEPCEVGIVIVDPFIVGAKRLAEIAAALPPGPVALEPGAAGLMVRAGKGKFTLPTLPLGEWPSLEQVAMPVTLTLPAAAIIDGLARAGRFASTEESRPTLNGISLVSDAENVRLTATDGTCLLTWTVAPAQGTAARGEWILPAAVATAAKTLGAEGEITLSLGERMARFQGTHGSFTSRLIEGPYPNVRQMLTLPASTTVRVDRVALAAAVKRVSAFTLNGNRLVDLAIDATAIRLTDAGSDTGSGQDEVACSTEGPAVIVRYNADKLLAALEQAVSEGAEVKLEIVGADRPLYCDSLAPADAGRRALVMPIRRDTVAAKAA